MPICPYYIYLSIQLRGVQEKLNFQNFATSPTHQHWAAIGRSENGQPIGVNVHLILLRGRLVLLNAVK